MILWLHPATQFLAILASFYVLYLGVIRFRAAHLGRKGLVFPWRRHVLLGATVLSTWGLGFGFGLGVLWWRWGEVFSTGLHHQVGLAMLPLIAFGLASGLVMDRAKAKRSVLPLAHGIANTALVLLSLWQLYTGSRLLRALTMD